MPTTIIAVAERRISSSVADANNPISSPRELPPCCSRQNMFPSLLFPSLTYTSSSLSQVTGIKVVFPPRSPTLAARFLYPDKSPIDCSHVYHHIDLYHPPCCTFGSSPLPLERWRHKRPPTGQRCNSLPDRHGPPPSAPPPPSCSPLSPHFVFERTRASPTSPLTSEFDPHTPLFLSPSVLFIPKDHASLPPFPYCQLSPQCILNFVCEE